MKLRKIILYLLIVSLLCLPLTACSGDTVTVNVKPEEMNIEDSCTVDENSNYSLLWDEAQTCVLLKSKTTSEVWSTVPYDFYLQGDSNINLSAPMFINYYNPSDGSLMTAKAYADCIEKGNLSVAVADGRVKMEFYFDDAEILVPLEISLGENGLKATVKTSDIKESGKTNLINVSVLPYLCSTPNAEDKLSYLFIPVGSGALMYTDEDVQEFSRTYSGEVYGSDQARHLLDDSTDEEPIRLPVYGVKNGNSAMLAIIEEGSEAATVTADAGNSRNGYSTVYSTFTVRGYDETEVERTSYSDALIYAEEYNPNVSYTVGYYPLSGDKADYNGMAELYKEYLSKNGGFTDSDLTQSPYQLSFLGGSLVRNVAVGIPYKRMQTATTFAEAQQIIEELTAETENTPSVILEGYTADGLDTGRIAGGYSLSSKLGGKKEYKELKAYCEEKGIALFAEYDIVQFNSSANGFSTNFDIAQTAGKQLAAFYPRKKNIRYSDEELAKTGLLQRSELEKAVNKLVKKTDYMSGISLTTLGSMAYSDYSNESYYAKGEMAAQVQSLLKKVSDGGHSLNVGAANGYAAQAADSISRVPLTGGEYFSLDESIPFYQMIFHGSSALYSTPINLSEDAVASVLRAVEGGVSLSFTLTANSSTALADTQSGEYYGSVYSGNKDSIIDLITKTADYFGKIGNQTIASHEIVSSAVTHTVFFDGTSVWVNHGKTAAKVEGTKLEGLSFRYESGGKVFDCNLSGGGQ